MTVSPGAPGVTTGGQLWTQHQRRHAYAQLQGPTTPPPCLRQPKSMRLSGRCVS